MDKDKDGIEYINFRIIVAPALGEYEDNISEAMNRRHVNGRARIIRMVNDQIHAQIIAAEIYAKTGKWEICECDCCGQKTEKQIEKYFDLPELAGLNIILKDDEIRER